MILSSINFTLLYLLIFKHRLRLVVRDEELRLYIGIVCAATLAITLSKWFTAGDLSEHSFRESLFNVVSMMSTTGFTTENFLTWPHLTWITLIIRNEFKRIIHPRAVIALRINNDYLASEVIYSIFAYICFFIILLACGISALIVMGLPIFDAFSLSISAYSNIGPGLGYAIGPLDAWTSLPDAGLWVSSFLMIAGRLEIFSLLLPFIPSFWKDN